MTPDSPFPPDPPEPPSPLAEETAASAGPAEEERTAPEPREEADADAEEEAEEARGDDDRDLGFGSVVSADSQRRLLNPDGSFNVERRGLPLRSRSSPYEPLLTMSWPRFLALVAGAYLVVNALFAVVYLLCGPDALGTAETEMDDMPGGTFWRAFFFSVETFSTVGYGHTVPVGWAAHAVMTAQVLVGLLGVALVTGMAFARFSRPRARILYSRKAVIAPFEGGRAFMFRIANLRKSQLIEVRARVIFSRFEPQEDGHRVRRYYSMDLRRSKVTFFPLAWTLVHEIDDDSPLAGLTREDCLRASAEFLVLLMATDESFSQVVHSRSSYVASEVEWNARFVSLFEPPDPSRPDTELAIDVDRLSDIEPVPEGGAGADAGAALAGDG